MRCLKVSLEYEGNFIRVGEIKGDTPADAVFTYAPEYLSRENVRPVSISLPVLKESFSPSQTKNYFEGLLPEGFTRKSVARYVHADEDDYLSILSAIGRECIGAVKIDEEGASEEEPAYRELSMAEVSSLAREGAAKSAQLVAKANLSLAGASGKAGLYYDKKAQKWYLPLGTAPSTHIVKQSHVRLKRIVANELLCMHTAAKLGLKTAQSFIIDTSGPDEEDVLFAAERYDRVFTDKPKLICGKAAPARLHQEDLAQAMGIAPDEKYERSGGEFDIRRISRDSFEKEAENIGLGRKLAMNRFDMMSENFEKALLSAKEELEKGQDISGLDDICERILSFR